MSFFQTNFNYGHCCFVMEISVDVCTMLIYSHHVVFVFNAVESSENLALLFIMHLIYTRVDIVVKFSNDKVTFFKSNHSRISIAFSKRQL